ncbi:uncharacterized protein LOC125764553 [Anopheles funestus]|uniref:uncharacterized protein LOC125764553 n=1 Tax=Anopheles funestus TaxID=62324 RepID=UPI0020C72E61|nr:uncharacterized protein LOC125764553 [Anopheles funestus]
MEFSRPVVVILLIVLLSCHYQAFGLKIRFESIEQTLGQDIAWTDIRVRKYNRTSTVANGTVYMSKEITNDYEYQLDVFYSRLGNQQFNHMPMKLPTAGFCNFIDHIYKNYPGYMSFFENGPQEGECPIKVRDVHVFDKEFPSEAVPPLLVRNGLYKALVSCVLHGTEVLSFSMILKATDI